MQSLRKNLIANKFVRIIEENHQVIVEHFMNDILKNPKTAAYRNFDKQRMYDIGSRVYRELSKWILESMNKEEVKNLYLDLGKMRKEEGIPESQVFQALVLLKRHMWLFIKKQMEYDVQDYKQAMDLSDKVVLFFDRAAYYMLVGYELEVQRKRIF